MTAACLIAGMAILPSIALGAPDVLYWTKVDFFVNAEGEGRKLDARLVLDPDTRMLTVADEKRPELATFATIPYDALTSATYSYSKHPRWKTGTALLIPFGVFAIPFYFMKGKKHWLAMTYEGVAEHPEGFLYLRLDKSNYLQIIAAIEGQTGISVERLESE
jgi:hypothetical protein